MHGLSLAFDAAVALRYVGRWDEAEEVLARVRLAGDDGLANDLHQLEAQVDVGRGRFERARNDLEAVNRLLERSEAPVDLVYLTCIRAELALWEAHPLEARAVLAEAAARLASMPRHVTDFVGTFHALALRAEADIAALARARRSAGQLEEARGLGFGWLERMQALHAEMGRECQVLMVWLTPYLTLAEAEHSRLAGASDPARWSATAAAFDALWMPFERAYALWREAEAHLTTAGSRVAAAEPLRTAHGITLALGAAPLRDELEALARRGRIGLGQAEPAETASVAPLEAFGLTSREREVLGLLAAGRTNREIATELFITEKTASVHVSNILGKLGVAHRIEAAAIAHRAGLG